jgi:hypothetical protein
MTKWEYYTEPSLNLAEPPLGMGEPEHGYREVLSRAGKHGWEAFAAWPISADGHLFCVLFKRPIE